MQKIYFKSKKVILPFILVIVVNKKVVAMKTSFLALITKNICWYYIFSNCSFNRLYNFDFFNIYFY